MNKTVRWILIIVIGGLLIANLISDRYKSPQPELFIPADGCLFRIETNNTPEFFTEVFVDGSLKIIIDDEIFWIRLEVNEK